MSEDARRAADALLGEAFELADAEQFRQRALRCLAGAIGFDHAVFVSYTRDFVTRMPAYLVDYLKEPAHRVFLRRAFAASRRTHGVYTDGEVYSVSERREQPFFRELLRPHHIHTQLVAVVHFGGRVSGVVHLNREGRGFGADDVARMIPIARTIGLAHAALEHSPTPLDLPNGDGRATPLTPREREVARWIAAGRGNAEIAQILGTATATVKHQVEAILRKLGVDNRAAAAAIVQNDLLREDLRLPVPGGLDPGLLENVWMDMQRSIPMR